MPEQACHSRCVSPAAVQGCWTLRDCQALLSGKFANIGNFLWLVPHIINTEGLAMSYQLTLHQESAALCHLRVELWKYTCNRLSLNLVPYTCTCTVLPFTSFSHTSLRQFSPPSSYSLSLPPPPPFLPSFHSYCSSSLTYMSLHLCCSRRGGSPSQSSCPLQSSEADPLTRGDPHTVREPGGRRTRIGEEVDDGQDGGQRREDRSEGQGREEVEEGSGEWRRKEVR